MKKIIFLTLFSFSIVSSFSQTLDANGKKQGYWKKYDTKGKLLYEGEFKNDKPISTFKYYYPNDSVKAIMNFKLEGKIAYSKLFHMNGKRMGEGKYINEEKDSVWLFFDEAGVLISKDNYKLGKKNGQSIVYLPDGNIAEERLFKDNVMNGPYKQYFGPGKLRGMGSYVNGELDGKSTHYYPNGVEVATGYYVLGKKNGPWIYRNENGTVKEKELFKIGVQANKKDTEAFFNKNKVQNTTVPKQSAVPSKTTTNSVKAKPGAKK
jgi:antitoxin component YwqK of YwqJK toxin-antitoxin module